jgi:hypothetical protein
MLMGRGLENSASQRTARFTVELDGDRLRELQQQLLVLRIVQFLSGVLSQVA